MSFLALDIGNTRLKWALYAAPHPQARLLHAAGVPILASEQHAGYLSDITPNPGRFALKVRGASMIDDGSHTKRIRLMSACTTSCVRFVAQN